MYCLDQKIKNTECLQYSVVVTIVEKSFVSKEKQNNLRKDLVHLLTLSQKV